MIKSALIVIAMSLLMNNIIASIKNLPSILLRKLVLVTFITENIGSIVAVEIGRGPQE